MRYALLAAAALLPAPAMAQEAPADSDTARVAEELRDPTRQAQMAVMVEAMAGAMLDMPVAPLVRAAREMAGEDARDIDPDLRMGDVVDPEVADAPAELAAKLPRMMGAVAGLAGAFEEMLPRLAEIGAQAGAQMRRELPETE